MVPSVVTTVLLLSSFAVQYGLHYKLFAPISARGQNTAPRTSVRAGATPSWAAASRPRRGRSRPFLCFVRVQMSPVAFMYPLFFQEPVIGLVLIWELKPYLKCRALASRHPISCCCRRIRPPGLAR